ncbi:hypothetical protein GPJ59_36690, partial [Streptomyces bambusae]|nr:hypothetical protein [Streptomyces bambusae]
PEREAVLPHSELAARVAEDVDAVVAARRADGTLDRRSWYAGMLLLARRVVVGAAAAEDTLLSSVNAAATAAVGGRAYADRGAALHRRLAPYLADPDPGALAGRLAAQGGGPQAVLPAVAHALALTSEAAAGTALQALALLGAGAVPGPREAVGEALRQFPPVAAAAYPVRAAFTWEGLELEAGTEVLWAPGWLRGLEQDVDGDGDRGVDRGVDSEGAGGAAEDAGPGRGAGPG